VSETFRLAELDLTHYTISLRDAAGGASEGSIRGAAVSERCATQADNVADIADWKWAGRADDAWDRAARYETWHTDGKQQQQQ